MNVVYNAAYFVYKIFSIVLVIFLILMTSLSVLLGVSGLDRETPKSILGFSAFIVVSSSMTPVFDAGDVIILRSIDTDKLEIGDIVTCTTVSSSLLTHRLVDIYGEAEEKRFVTRGEANNADDEPIEADRILGKVLFSLDRMGSFMLRLKEPSGIIILIAVIALGLFVIPSLFDLYLKKKTVSDVDGGNETNRKTAAEEAGKDIQPENTEQAVLEDLAGIGNNEKDETDKTEEKKEEREKKKEKKAKEETAENKKKEEKEEKKEPEKRQGKKPNVKRRRIDKNK